MQKKILKRIVFIIILIILILCIKGLNFFGYVLFVNKENEEEIINLLELENIDYKNAQIIIVESKASSDDIVEIVTSNFNIYEYRCASDSDFIEYVEEKGIDIYDFSNKVIYFYVIAFAIIIFFNKLLENVDKYGKFEERDN